MSRGRRGRRGGSGGGGGEDSSRCWNVVVVDCGMTSSGEGLTGISPTLPVPLPWTS